MVDNTSLAYTFIGDLQRLRAGVLKSCDKMSLKIKSQHDTSDGFIVKAGQKTNWLSTNWPMTFEITVETVGTNYVVLISGSSSIGSLTQSSNNSAKSQELLSLIQAYCPSDMSL